MKNNTDNSAEAMLAVKASPGQDTLRPVFDSVPRAQVENTENSHTNVVVFDRGGQYNGIAIPIDIVAWKNDTDQRLASMERELASTQRRLDIALECPVCFNHCKAMRLQCGHLLCQACVEQVTMCPTCRQPVGASPPQRVFP